MRTSCNDLNLLSWGVARIRSQGRPAGAVESNESVGTIENSITTKEDPLDPNRTTLLSLPSETLTQILALLPRRTVFALSLISKLCYAICKYNYPLPPEEAYIDRDWEVMEWIQASHSLSFSYRLEIVGGKWQFLNRRVYGDEPNGEKELRLKERYNDYGDVKLASSQIMVRETDRRLRRHPVLPYPFYMGESWYAKAVSVIEEDLELWDEIEDWYWYWNHCMLFNKPGCRRYFRIVAGLQIFSEWLKQVDF